MFHLPELPFSYAALEPYIDSQTMKVHHNGHHRAYVDKLNQIVARHPEIHGNVEELLENLDKIPSNIRTDIRNQGGGHANHSFFWQILSPRAGQRPGSDLDNALDSSFGSLDQFKEIFSELSSRHFSNGWTWLVLDPKRGLLVRTTRDQESPLTDGQVPLLTLDLWEHAYYLKHQNRRPEYIDAFWHIVNWAEVDRIWDKTQRRNRIAV